LLLEPRPALREKRLALLTRNPQLQAVLAALLEEWEFRLLDQPEADDLVLAEEGCLPPAGCRNLLWLTTSRYVSRQRLSLPVSLTELWQALETRFHKPPRQHLRMGVGLEATVRCRGERTASRLVSLSDMGGRFSYPRELVNGEEVDLELALGGEPLRLAGRVIYVVPRGELHGTTETEVGVIFDRTPPETRAAVRDHLLCGCLEQVRLRLAEPLFCAGLAYLDIPSVVLRRLGCAPEEPSPAG
jgi:hypothetical protein